MTPKAEKQLARAIAKQIQHRTRMVRGRRSDPRSKPGARAWRTHVDDSTALAVAERAVKLRRPLEHALDTLERALELLQEGTW